MAETLPSRIVIFDGLCNLCEFSVNFIPERDSSGRFTFTPAQSPLGRKLLDRDHLHAEQVTTVVLIKDGKAFTKSAAALAIAEKLDCFRNLLYLFAIIPQPPRDPACDLTEKNRYLLCGKKERCMIPDQKLQNRFPEKETSVL
ncbi:MAG: DUF393 domain-containing protein [Chlorobiaceae bacterium]|nr:DUF393 domain-containing protein [Chlorobiaceae bacterium]